MGDFAAGLAKRRRRRLAWLAAAISLILLLLGVRLFHLQIVRGGDLAALAVGQRTEALPLSLGRGLILDRHLRPLHAPLVSWRLAVFTPYLEHPDDTAAWIASLTELDARKVGALLREADGFVVLGSPLDPTRAGRLVDLRTGEAAVPPGVSVVQMEERYGPGAVAPHVVGYVRLADNVGVAGLEKAFDGELKGRHAATLLARYDAHRRPLGGFRVLQAGRPAGGHDIVTTLDWEFQQRVERALARLGKTAAAVVLDARTGAVLAMASHPGFHAGRLADYLDRADDRPLVNRAVSAYPPGSVFKMVTAAAGLEQGVLTADRLFECRGYLDVGDRRFPSQCPDGDGAADASLITWEQGMAASSNEVFIQVALELGAEALLAAAADFGFGRVTGVPLPEDRAGHLPDPRDIRFGGDLANLGIGQGPLTATPLQVAQFLTAVVNDGRLQPVHLIREIRRGDGVLVREYDPPAPRQIMSPETAAALRRALRAVVREGTGTLAEVDTFGAAGKTGTAETGRILPGGEEVVHAWFAGYVPATLPRYIIVVLVEDGRSGPRAAAPLFGEVAETLLRHDRNRSRIP